MANNDRTRLEVENGFRQFDKTMELVEYFLEPERPFRLTPNIVMELQREAVEGIQDDAGQLRSTTVEITGSKHRPPIPGLVQMNLVEMCEYVNDNWHEKTAFFLSAYCMWRLNWIHPFSDGNGRTSRSLSYLVLCVRVGHPLPGEPTIPQQIEAQRTPYVKALETADSSVDGQEFDISAMEDMIRDMLARQLLWVIEKADGTLHF